MFENNKWKLRRIEFCNRNQKSFLTVTGKVKIVNKHLFKLFRINTSTYIENKSKTSLSI